MNDQEQNFNAWRPKIDISGAARAVNEVVDKGKKIINNTLGDIDYIFDNVKDCVKTCGISVDNIRLRLMHRAIQYITLFTPIVCKTSNTWLLHEMVYPKVAASIRHYAKPKILHLTNPERAVWGDAQGNTEAPHFDEIIPENFVFSNDREAWVFIHGMLYKAIKEDGSDFSSDKQDDVFDFFKNFEKEARIFKPSPQAPSPPDKSKIDIYLISYDSEMRDEEETLIKIYLAEHIWRGNNHLAAAAVFWFEMTKRAEETGNYIKPFVEKLVGNQGRAITHSLGCHVLAHAANQIMEKNRENRAFSSWWCMSAALPSNVFSNTGNYNLAPLIAGQYDGLRHGTSVWYSLADQVLMLLYPFAACTTALGLTGLGVNDDGWAHDYDITKITDVHHGSKGEYIKRLGPYIRRALQTES